MASFNIIEGMVHFIEDGSYFNDMRYALDDSLMVGHMFRTKYHLKWVMRDFYIRANRTFKIKCTSKPFPLLICGYEWFDSLIKHWGLNMVK
jgi:hypothetical protein